MGPLGPIVSLTKQLRPTNPQPVEPELADDAKRGQPIAAAALEVDAAGLVEVAHRHGNIAEPEAEPHALHQELRVEDEFVGVVLEGYLLQHFPAVNTEAAVEVAQ